jgi:predicted phosphodiesterase
MKPNYRPHSKEQLERIFHAVTQHGPALAKIAEEQGLTSSQVAGIKRRHRAQWDAAYAQYRQGRMGEEAVEHEPRVVPKEAAMPTSTIEDKQVSSGDRTLHSRGTRLKTVEDLLAHMEVDLANHCIVEQQVTQNEQVTKDDEGNVLVTPYYRIFVKLRPKEGVNWTELADQMLETALRERSSAAIVGVLPKSTSNVWQVMPIADPHFGKYSWHGSTGYPDYDLEIAREYVMSAGLDLLEKGSASFQPGRRTLAFLGDVFHYDTPHGTTTGGTPLERDGRMPKMVDVGTDTVLRLIEESARTAMTDVLFVRGNHDEALTTFLQKTVREVFRNEPRVQVNAEHTHRKYLFHEGTLLGFTHGDKAKKKLPALMPHEAKEWWYQATYYEWHTGHTHAMRAEWQRPVETLDGVLVRVAPALCPPDDWHADHGFVGSLKAMETFFYRPGGGFIGMLLSSPQYTEAG